MSNHITTTLLLLLSAILFRVVERLEGMADQDTELVYWEYLVKIVYFFKYGRK